MGLSAEERDRIVEEETLRQETRGRLAWGGNRRWLWLILAFALGLALGGQWGRHRGCGWGGGCRQGWGAACPHGMGWGSMEGKHCTMGGMQGMPAPAPAPAGPPPAKK